LAITTESIEEQTNEITTNPVKVSTKSIDETEKTTDNTTVKSVTTTQIVTESTFETINIIEISSTTETDPIPTTIKRFTNNISLKTANLNNFFNSTKIPIKIVCIFYYFVLYNLTYT
jgi:hypothetical protein